MVPTGGAVVLDTGVGVGLNSGVGLTGATKPTDGTGLGNLFGDIIPTQDKKQLSAI